MYFKGIYQIYIISQCIANAQTLETGTKKYNGQAVGWTGLKRQGYLGEWCWLLRAAGLVFTESPADTGIISSHWFTFCLQPTFPSTFLHWWKSHPSLFLPLLLWLKCWSETVNYVSDRGGDRCYLLCPSLQKIQNHLVSVVLRGEVYVPYAIIG